MKANSSALAACCMGLWIAAGTAQAAPITFFATASTAAGIQATVDAYRADLGTLNPNVAGSFAGGRREINWDGVPDAFSSPNNLPANFFNVNSPRGVVFSTTGTGFQVSATAASGTPVEFGNFNFSYPAAFATFSPQRLFTSLGTNLTDVSFFVPGSATAALTRGFGAVFTDVDFANVSSLTFFDANDAPLGTFFVPNLSGSETLSFLGIDFGAPVVSRVRIRAGNSAIGPTDAPDTDVVVLDDFIYAEPVARNLIPEPSTLAMLLLAVFALGAVRRSPAA